MNFNNIKDLKEECGVFAIQNSTEAHGICYFALHAIQHRGQDAGGISWVENNEIIIKKDFGLISNVFSGFNFKDHPTTTAIGHTRYRTSGDQNINNAHPFHFKNKKFDFSSAHNGNISNSYKFRKQLLEEGIELKGNSDSEIIGHLILKEECDLFNAIANVCKKLAGAFSFVFMTKDNTIYAARDKIGFRPLALGKHKGNYVIASESVAFDAIEAELIRDIKPGEVIKIKDNKIESIIYDKSDNPKTQLDAMELIYFSRPDSIIDGVAVSEFREKSGAKLFEETTKVKADMVVPVPDSSIFAAIGYSLASGIPFEFGLIKNRYVARTFIEPTQSERELAVNKKLNALSSVKGKDIILIDDSIVRGTTIKRIIKLLKNKGANKIHIRVASPKIIAPSYYGINISTYDELVAHHYKTDKEIANYIKADSTEFISVDGIKACAPNIDLEMCIFTNEYQTEISQEYLEEAKNGKK